MRDENLHGALTFLGFMISIMAIFYFAIEYIPRVSEWTRLAALILLGLSFGFLATYVRTTMLGRPFFDWSALRWLSPPWVLYLLAMLCGIVAEGVFLSMDSVARPLKILVSLVLGVGIILVVAMRQRDGSAQVVQQEHD